MKQYIDKAAVVAEIERRISNHNKELQHASDEDFVSSWASDEENQKLALTALIPFLNTLEVKEVDEEYNGKAMLHVLEKGVEQGRRELIDKACEWLKKWDAYRVCLEGNKDWFIEQFRKAMKE